MWPCDNTNDIDLSESIDDGKNLSLQDAGSSEDGRFSPDLVAANTIASGRPQPATPTTTEESAVGHGMVDLLRQAPHLLQVCALMSVLKELRTVSQETRTLATSHISSFTVDCVQPVIASTLQESLTLLRACSLGRLRVVLDIQQHGKYE